MDLASLTTIPYTEDEWAKKMPLLQEATFYLNYYDSGGTLDEEPLYVAAKKLNIKIIKIQCGGYDYMVTVKCENLGDLYHFGIEHLNCINEKAEWEKFLKKNPLDEKTKELTVRLLKLKLPYLEYESLRKMFEDFLNEQQNNAAE